MKLRYLACSLTIGLTSLVASQCQAETLTYFGHLSASSEVPPTKAFALADVTLTVSGDLLSLHMDFSNFVTPPIGGGVHWQREPWLAAPPLHLLENEDKAEQVAGLCALSTGQLRSFIHFSSRDQ